MCSVSKVARCGLDHGGSIPNSNRNLSLRRHVQPGSLIFRDYYQVGAGGGVIKTEADNSLRSSVDIRIPRNFACSPPTLPVHFHGMIRMHMYY
jgi:hypothetical protein